MKILITGGTGFIGSYLLHQLSQETHHIILLTRSESRTTTVNKAEVKYVHWNSQTTDTWSKELDGCDIVINLIGKNIFEERWNGKVKQEILNSRITPTKLLVEAIARMERKPSLLISISAVGFYGDRNDEVITEQSSGGNDFLADVVKQWEEAACEAEQYDVRVVTPRIGLVLEKSGGVIGKMLLPFKLFVGGPIGSGQQFLPWIHMDDVVRGILYPIENKNFHGVYNLVSPNPITMNEFSKSFGNVLHRPSWIHVPNVALQILYGEGSKVILSGQRAVPEKLLTAGYRFSFSDLKIALKNILS
ncbi:MAG: TIGR01777 family oxidoreductase [Bacteroidota bacterium]|nr:TIGR01777 family oxidoreductase [Bacteroidota bacterium]